MANAQKPGDPVRLCDSLATKGSPGASPIGAVTDDRNRPDASVQSGCCSTLAKDEEQHSRLEIPSVALRVIAQHALGVFVVIRRLRAARSGVPLPLTFWESVAVDPRLIAEGSRIYIPAYRNSPAHGWFLAQDTGGAIRGHHIDVYRSPPQSPLDPGQTVGGQPVYVLPPGQSLPAVAASERMPPPPGTPISIHTTRRPKHRPAPTPKASVPPAAPTVPASVTGATYMPALPGDDLSGGAAAP